MPQVSARTTTEQGSAVQQGILKSEILFFLLQLHLGRDAFDLAQNQGLFPRAVSFLSRPAYRS